MRRLPGPAGRPLCDGVKTPEVPANSDITVIRLTPTSESAVIRPFGSLLPFMPFHSRVGFDDDPHVACVVVTEPAPLERRSLNG